MTDPDYTAVCLLIDRSGSMEMLREDAQRTLDGFVRGQADAPGRRTIRIDVFDDGEPASFCLSTPAADVPPFTLDPRGSTALLDAMGITIVAFGRELAAMPEHQRPGHVVFAVMTDGEENSSTRYTWKQISEMVRHHETVYNWDVIYLGANQDAIATGARLGVRRGRSLTYTTSAVGVASAGIGMSRYVDDVADGGTPAFTDSERAAAVLPDASAAK